MNDLLVLLAFFGYICIKVFIFFGQNGGPCGPFCCVNVLFNCWPSWPPHGPHLGSIFEGFRLHLGSILENNLAFLGQLFQARRPHTYPKLLDGSLCRSPSACRTRGGGNAACRAKDSLIRRYNITINLQTC